MATTVSAAVLSNFGDPVEVVTIEVDDPGPAEVLVRTAACGVCHSDVHFQHGSMGGPTPAVLGHEPAGVVEAVGVGVTCVRPGDHVVVCDSLYCGGCGQCLRGRMHLCADRGATRRPRGSTPRVSVGGKRGFAFAEVGGMAEAMLVHQNAVVRVDDDIPLDRAALLGCAVVTGLGAVLNTARVPPGSTVAVFGCGGVGSAVVQGARIAGARRIIAVDLSEAKLERARHFGATDSLIGGDDAAGQIRELTGGGVDYAFDAVGHTTLLKQCFSALTTRGTAVAVGALSDGRLQIDARQLMLEKTLTGSFMGSNQFPIDIPYYLDLYRQGRLDLDSMISDRVPLAGVNDAFAALGRGEVLTRSVVTFA